MFCDQLLRCKRKLEALSRRLNFWRMLFQPMLTILRGIEQVSDRGAERVRFSRLRRAMQDPVRFGFEFKYRLGRFQSGQKVSSSHVFSRRLRPGQEFGLQVVRVNCWD